MQKRAGIRTSREEFEGLFDLGQSLPVLSWPLHREYWIGGGRIYGEGSDGRAYQPLEDPDLFRSFIRLAARGQPSETSILRWVEKHGLLRRGDESEGVNQEPMSVDAFREEVRCARQLAGLFTEIRQENCPAIWARLTGEGEHRESRLHSNVVDSYFATFQEAATFRRPLEPPDHEAHLHHAVGAFEYLLSQLISDVSLRPTSHHILYDGETVRLHRHLGGTYKPVLSWRCPDLRSAIYLQLALVTTSSKPVRLCKRQGCGLPFVATRKDKVYCNDSCRSAARKDPKASSNTAPG